MKEGDVGTPVTVPPVPKICLRLSYISYAGTSDDVAAAEVQQANVTADNPSADVVVVGETLTDNQQCSTDVVYAGVTVNTPSRSPCTLLKRKPEDVENSPCSLLSLEFLLGIKERFRLYFLHTFSILAHRRRPRLENSFQHAQLFPAVYVQTLPEMVLC
jgi:hypothetical protein